MGEGNKRLKKIQRFRELERSEERAIEKTLCLFLWNADFIDCFKLVTYQAGLPTDQKKAYGQIVAYRTWQELPKCMSQRLSAAAPICF